MYATTVGSLPCKDPQKAVDLVMKYTPEIPAWPQLPKKTFKENMCAQYSEGFPGIVINEPDEKIYVDSAKSFAGLERFYENYLANNTGHFEISPGYAAGLYELLSRLGKNPGGVVAVKGQCVGPLTFGLTVKDESGRAIFYDSQLRDAVIKHIIMKSVFQFQIINESAAREIILFLDEPYLSAYGSAFTSLSHEEAANTIKETVEGIRNAISPSKAKLGIHCCGNTDWSLLLDSGIDIISFDAYEFFENLLLYSEKIKGFIARGGALAWGIVPTAEETLNLETPENLGQILVGNIKKLADKGIKKNTEGLNSFITPACGLGSRSEEAAERALFLTHKLGAAPKGTVSAFGNRPHSQRETLR